MKLLKLSSSFFLISLITACGGGGNAGTSNSPAATSYNFVIPPPNSQRIYSSTIIDNSSNTINLSYTETVTAINANGTYTTLTQDPSNNSITVNGTTYSIHTEISTINNAGQVLSFVDQTAQITCTYSPSSAGAPYPVTVGENWTLNTTESCGSNAPVNFIQTGTVVDVESVTVPAGTYNALKLQSTINYTDAAGTIVNEAITNWRDANTGVSVKQQIAFTYSGTPLTNGYAVTKAIELQSGTL
jgi:hypothetical protein